MAKKKEEVVVEETQVEVTPTANQDGMSSRDFRSTRIASAPVVEEQVAEDGGQEEA